MDTKISPVMQFYATWTDSPKYGRNPSDSLRFSRGLMEERRRQRGVSLQFHTPSNQSCNKSVFCCHNTLPACVSSVMESGNVYAPVDSETLILKNLQNKSREIEPYLKGRSIYLVGMMGSGKTTVGKVLSGALDYVFRDSDKLVEEDLGATSVAEIFKLYGEDYFRRKESAALQELSRKHRLVVSTGGGAVVEDRNWMYMNKGISIWLDVPLEELAQRIAAVGTDSRPLLHDAAGDAYTKALNRLSTLFEERHKAYTKATLRVSLENIAAKLGHKDVSNIAPLRIAIEALEQIESFL